MVRLCVNLSSQVIGIVPLLLYSDNNKGLNTVWITGVTKKILLSRGILPFDVRRINWSCWSYEILEEAYIAWMADLKLPYLVYRLGT